jgi:hypothetical protein
MDPVTGRRVCFYFNQRVCAAGERCAFMHVKVREGGGREGGREMIMR